MRRRLLTAMLLVAIVAVAGFGVPLALSVQARYRDEALLTLSEEAATAAVAVPGSFVRDNDRPELPSGGDDVRIALYGVDGQRLQGDGPARADATVDAVLGGGGAQRDRGDLVVAVPISDEEVVVGAVRASTPDSVVAARTYRTWAAMVALALAVLAVAGLVAARRSRSLARPLAQLRADAEIVGAGGEVPSRSDTGVDEIDLVHAALADASTRLNTALARERSLSADIAHQLRTPLASLRLRLENEGAGVASTTALVDDALRDVDRLEQTIDDLLRLVPRVPPRHRTTRRRRRRGPRPRVRGAPGARQGPVRGVAGEALGDGTTARHSTGPVIHSIAVHCDGTRRVAGSQRA